MVNNKRPRVWGPHRHGRGYRCYFRREGKTCATETVETLAEAERLKRALERELAAQDQLTVADALGQYEQFLIAKGNKPGSIKLTVFRLRDFFPDHDVPVAHLTAREAAALYQRLVTEPRPGTGRPLAADTHRNALAQAKSFMKWCVSNGHLPQNPLHNVSGQGRRRRGKAQLGIDESRKLSHKALELAEDGDQGALAVLVLLYVGLRAGELVNLRVRDLDDRGRVLWVRDSHLAEVDHLKTPAAQRAPSVPRMLRPLLAELARGRPALDYLFGKHWRDWPREQVERVCKLAGVPQVTAHGLRGMKSTLALLAGDNPEIVARSLGHRSSKITLNTYAAPGTKSRIEQDRVERVLNDTPATPTRQRRPKRGRNDE